MVTRGRLPGATIGQVFRTGTSLPRDFPRYTGIIAKGLDIRLFRDAEITRSSVDAEVLPFSGTTYIAPLANSAIPDKTRARLYTTEGRTISADRWNFTESIAGSNVFDQVQLDPVLFSMGVTYLFDYISNNPNLQDEVPVEDLREVVALGDNQGQAQYKEGKDFFFTTSIVGPDAKDTNSLFDTRELTPIVANAGNSANDATIDFNVGAVYNHDYNRAYRITVSAAAVGPPLTATLEIEVFPVSSGTDSLFGHTAAKQNVIEVTLDNSIPATLTNIGVELGISLDFSLGTTGFFVGDSWTFQGRGPGMLELDDSNLNMNQYPTTSAMVAQVSGQGGVAINPQSIYTGTINQSFELEVTAIPVATGVNRSATFVYRAKEQLRTLTGTLTATNGSPTVVGAGTQLNVEVVANDWLFIGDDVEPVQVLSVTNSGSLELTANYAAPTQTTVKALRVREVAGTINVAADTTHTRVTLTNGIFLDFDFGNVTTNNFVVGDLFSFTASAARNPYNGKENRDYLIRATDTSTVHNLVASYSGTTPSSGFGSTTFSEGNPLVLPNNMIVHARNVSLVHRYTSSDEFTATLTFDGLIDWTPSEERTEIVGTSDILRDLTGSVTGTVGAYFLLLRKVPTQVLFVRGPSPTFTNLAFSQVPGTTIIWFPTNPGVAVTVKYRFAGNEPVPGASYFLSGYQKRPASDFNKPQLFFTKDEATAWLAPMTPTNDAAIANQVAWDQDEAGLPGVVVCLVNDSDGDGNYTNADYEEAIRVSEEFKDTLDLVVVNRFGVRDTLRDSTVSQNQPARAHRRIAYTGFPVGYPIGDTLTSGSRVFVGTREMQVFQDSPARGTLAIVGAASATKTIMVDSLGDGNIDRIPTEVTLDGSFIAVALAARVSSFAEPWQIILNLPVSGFNSIEDLTTSEMIRLLDAGIIPIRVEGDSGFYAGTRTTDTREPSTSQLSGTVQRQYVFARLQNAAEERVVGYVAESAEDAAQKTAGEIGVELGSMVAEGKIGRYQNEDGTSRPFNPNRDVVAFRDRRDPTRTFFRASYYNKYGILFADGVLSVDAPTP